MDRISVFAPASVANVAVGFDCLGFAFAGLGDTITISILDKGESTSIELAIEGNDNLPLDPSKNTAGRAIFRVLELIAQKARLKVQLKKGIPLGSGMGGSAASAVAATVAANLLFGSPLDRQKLLDCALEGEFISSGARHPDNVAPSLLGGLTLILGPEPFLPISLPIPDELRVVLLHPHFEINTTTARSLLKPTLELKSFVRQNARMAAFIAGLYRSDYCLIARALIDEVIEPQRAPLIPNFDGIKKAALCSGALCCSISGSGPSMFAFTRGDESSEQVESAMSGYASSCGLVHDTYRGRIATKGAAVIGNSCIRPG